MKTKKISVKIHRGILYGAIALGCFIAVSNTYASQQLPALFYPYIEEGRGAVITYLSRIKTLPVFEAELSRYKSEYGADIQNEVFKEDVLRKKRITALEEGLKKQPQSRDILYALSLLYKEGGDEKKASYYLEKARTVDPLFPN
jgi:hypothetical protein